MAEPQFKLENYIRPSKDDFKRLESSLTYYFGEDFKFINSIRSFEQTESFITTHPIWDEQEITEIYENDIYMLMQTEERAKKQADEILRMLNNIGRELTREEILSVAKSLGLYPREELMESFKYVYPYNVICDSYYNFLREISARDRKFDCQALFNNIIPFYAMTDEKKEKFKQDFETNIKHMDLIFSYIIDFITPKFTHRLKDGRLCVEYGFARNYYRGENAFYGSSKAGIYRDGKADIIDVLISIIKMREIGSMFQELNFSKEYEPMPIYVPAFAQHYGIKTSCIDITSDFKVALFFACCTYDSATKTWRPLNDEDFKYKYSRKRLRMLGGDSRYAVIYKTPADIVEMSNSLDNGPYKQVHHIGLQPFLRGETQKGYILETDMNYDLYKDRSFQKYKFRLNSSFCQWIFNEMDGGKKLFPDEIMTYLDHTFSLIDELKEFNRRNMEYIYYRYHVKENLNLTIEQFEKTLKQRGHTCKEQKLWCDEQTKQEIDKLWKQKYNRIWYENISVRWCFSIGKN